MSMHSGQPAAGFPLAAVGFNPRRPGAATRRTALAVAASLLSFSISVSAQTVPAAAPTAVAPAVQRPASDRMARDERILFGLLTATYGLRLGSAINLGAFGRTPDDPEPETYWILPGALAIAVPVAALLIEHRYPLRRGRGLVAGTSGLLGYLGATALRSWIAEESFPSGKTLSGWSTFIGTTSGIALGALVGHLTDATPADALWVGTGGVGGALLGGLICGAVRCGPDLGAYALVGEVALLTTAILTRSLVRPTQPTMRLVGAGALGTGILMGGGVLLAHGVRDGELTREGVQRSAVFGLAGLVVGAATFYAIGRQAEGRATVVPTAQVTGQGMVLGLAMSN